MPVPPAASADAGEASADGGCDVEPSGVETVVSLPMPTGPFGVARGAHRTVVDAARDEPDSADATDKRKISIEIWYPIERCATGAEAPIVDAPEHFLLPAKSGEWWSKVRTHVKSGVPMVADGKRHPVLLFSPGYGGLAHVYTAVLADLVSRGFVIVALSHTYWDAVTIFADGSTTSGVHTPSPDGIDPSELLVWEGDQKRVLDELASLDGEDGAEKLAGRLDLDHVGAFGHSFGGATAVQLSAHEPRVRAALDLDGTVFDETTADADAGVDAGADGGAALPITAPVLLFRSDRPEDPTFTKTVARATGPAYELVLAKSGHFTFSDGPIIGPAFGQKNDPAYVGTIDPRRGIAVTSAYVSAFFSTYLASEKSPLLDGASADYPEIVFTKK